MEQISVWTRFWQCLARLFSPCVVDPLDDLLKDPAWEEALARQKRYLASVNEWDGWDGIVWTWTLHDVCLSCMGEIGEYTEVVESHLANMAKHNCPAKHQEKP